MKLDLETATNQDNKAMISNSLKLFLILFVALVGISAMPFAAPADARQAPSDRGNTGFQPLQLPQSTSLAKQGLVRDKIQLQLLDVRIQLEEARRKYGNNHPEVQSLEARTKLLKAELKSESGASAPRPALTSRQLELQQKFQRAEQRASQLAQALLNADSSDEESKRSMRVKLQNAVQEAFDLRMQLQNSQLDDAEAKLAASRQRLVRRQSLAKQIVDRRVKELIGQDETKWVPDSKESVVENDSSNAVKQIQTVDDKPAKVIQPKSTYPAFELSPGLEGLHGIIPELEGTWRLRDLHVDSSRVPPSSQNSLRLDKNRLLAPGLREAFGNRDSQDLRVYSIKGQAGKLVIWNSGVRGKQFHLATFNRTGSQLGIAIKKSICDLKATYGLKDFPELKSATGVIFLECDVPASLRSLDGLGSSDSDHYFSLQNNALGPETIREHSPRGLEGIGEAKRIAELQGRWTANKISLDGEDRDLTDPFKLYLQNTFCVQFGTHVLDQQNDKRVRMFAYPDLANSFIIIKSFGYNGGHHISAYVGSFARQDATLRLAVKKFDGDKEPPALAPGKGVLYLELKTQDPLGDPIQLRFIDTEETANKLVHVFDARNSSENTASITRLECAPEYGWNFDEVSRFETQTTLKPGEVRRIELPVRIGGSDWRVWVRGGPADELLSEHWTPVIGFYDNSSKPSQGASDVQRHRLFSETERSQKRRPQDDGVTVGQRIGKLQNAKLTSPPQLVDPMHKVRAGDVLSVVVPFVFGEIDSKFKQMGSGYPIHVKSDGMISLPAVGRLKVAGKTVLEIENEVKKKYVEGTEPILREEEHRNKISVVVRQAYEPTAGASSSQGIASLVDPMHQVRAGDVLSIFVPHVFDDMDRGPTSPGYPIHVKSDGMISLPAIGRLKAAGKTAIEIENEVKKKYTDGPDPILTEEYRDSISVIVHQIYKPSVKAESEYEHVRRIKAESVKKLRNSRGDRLFELKSDLARSETALAGGREACLKYIWILEATGKIDPRHVPVHIFKRIEQQQRLIEEHELARDQFLPEGPGASQFEAHNLAINARKKMIVDLDAEAKTMGTQPEQIIQSHIVGIKQQIDDLRSAMASEVETSRENYRRALKIELPDAGRSNKLVEQLDNTDAAQLAAQTFVEGERIPEPLKLELIHSRLGKDRQGAMHRIRVTNVSKQDVRVTNGFEITLDSGGNPRSKQGYSLAAGESKRIELAKNFPADWKVVLRGHHGPKRNDENQVAPIVVGQFSHHDREWLPAPLPPADSKQSLAYPLSMEYLDTVQDAPAFKIAPALLRSYRVSNPSDQTMTVIGFVCENGSPVRGDLTPIAIPPKESKKVTIQLPLDYDSKWQVNLQGYAGLPGDISEKKPVTVASYSPNPPTVLTPSGAKSLDDDKSPSPKQEAAAD